MLQPGALQLKIEQWQKQTPQSHFHFRSYNSTLDNDKESLEEESSYTQTLLYCPPRAMATTALEKVC